VHNPHDFDDIAAQTVSRNVWRTVDGQFPRPCPATGPTDLREREQTGYGGEHALNLLIGGQRIVARDIGPGKSQIAQSGSTPDYSHSGMGSSSGRPHD